MNIKLPVSVIMPAYNAQRFVRRAVLSIANQTEHPLEVIIVDDGSKDDTWDMVLEASKEFSFLQIQGIRLPFNSGPGAARDAGWDRAKGKYVAFLDADDVWHPDKLKLQYSWMVEKHNLVITGHRCDVIAEQDVEPVNTDDMACKIRSFSFRDFLISNRLSTPSVMVKTSLSMRFPDNLRYCEDYYLWLEIVSLHGEVGWIDLPLAHLFKAKYGASGLSSELYQMERGELIALKNIYKAQRITLLTWAVSVLWSILKFLNRLVLCWFIGDNKRFKRS